MLLVLAATIILLVWGYTETWGNLTASEQGVVVIFPHRRTAARHAECARLGRATLAASSRPAAAQRRSEVSGMKPMQIGVAGSSSSGKTTVALRILEHVGLDRIAYLPQDAYYRDASNLPPGERA